jgi:hypothetical protein
MNIKIYYNVRGHGAVCTQHVPIYSFGYYDYQGYVPTDYGEIYGMFRALVVDICHADRFIAWM